VSRPQNPLAWLDAFMLNAAYQLGDGDLSGNQIGGDDYECDCDQIEGLHYEWDHGRAASSAEKPSRAPSDKRE
jgi:hypothetical protein